MEKAKITLRGLKSSGKDKGLIGNYNLIMKNAKIMVKIECDAHTEKEAKPALEIQGSLL